MRTSNHSTRTRRKSKHKKASPLRKTLKNVSEGYADAKLDPDEFARFKTALAKLFEKINAGAGEGEDARCVS
ncbi:MAG: hypothetical protein ACRC46_09895 [Thermoguttaceae bacterium]